MVDFIISKERTNVYKEKEAGSAEHRVAQAALIERQYAAEAKAREKKRIAQEKEREAQRKAKEQAAKRKERELEARRKERKAQKRMLE